MPSDCPLITADELVWQVKRAKSAALQNLFEGDSFNETSQVVLGAEVAMAAELAGAALAEAQAIDARCESFEGVWLDDQAEGVGVGTSDGPVASSSAAQSPITTPITTPITSGKGGGSVAARAAAELSTAGKPSDGASAQDVGNSALAVGNSALAVGNSALAATGPSRAPTTALLQLHPAKLASLLSLTGAFGEDDKGLSGAIERAVQSARAIGLHRLPEAARAVILRRALQTVIKEAIHWARIQFERKALSERRLVPSDGQDGLAQDGVAATVSMEAAGAAVGLAACSGSGGRLSLAATAASIAASMTASMEAAAPTAAKVEGGAEGGAGGGSGSDRSGGGAGHDLPDCIRVIGLDSPRDAYATRSMVNAVSAVVRAMVSASGGVDASAAFESTVASGDGARASRERHEPDSIARMPSRIAFEWL